MRHLFLLTFEIALLADFVIEPPLLGGLVPGACLENLLLVSFLGALRRTVALAAVAHRANANLNIASSTVEKSVGLEQLSHPKFWTESPS